MILDVIERGHHYNELHPMFARAFAYLRATDFSAMHSGRHEIEGERLYLSLDETTGRGREGAKLEHHRRYIDIQVCLEGIEQIGWMPLGCCNRRAGEFDGTGDIGFFDDVPQSWVTLAPGTFVVLFPADAHAPLGGTGHVRKAVLKVLV